MYARLAVRNVVRSAKDYAVYFVTLLLGVAMFYAFNSVEGQEVLLDLESSSAGSRMFDMTRTMLSIFSMAVAAILAFLVLYANRFLISRRKREFGMYLMLGMTPAKVARMVLMETLLVGVVALALGMALGIALSQGLSFVTAGLMGEVLEDYRFIVSEHAVVLTLASFAVIFLLVAALNVFTVSHRKLADLLSMAEGAEKLRVRHVGLRCVVFAAALAVLAAAYWQLHLNGFVELMDDHFKAATALMLVGTALFFWSVSGVAILALQHMKGAYYRGLSMFTVRQVSSKVNTAFVSMSVTCVLLFLTITVVSCGAGFVKLFVGDVEEATRYDATVRADLYQDPNTGANSLTAYRERNRAFEKQDPEAYERWRAYDGDLAAMLSDGNPEWDKAVGRSAQLDRYAVDGLDYADILPKGATANNEEIDKNVRRSPVAVVGISQFNDVRGLLGQKPLDLMEGECLVNNTMSATQDMAEELAQSGAELTVEGTTLRVSKDVVVQPDQTSAMADVGLELVVPDSVIQGLKDQGAIPVCSFLNVMYKQERAEGNQTFVQALAQACPGEEGEGAFGAPYKNSAWPLTMVTLASNMVEQSGGLRMLITYIAVYVGLVMLICTAAVLAIQQLSETSDSLGRYRKLSQLGADSRMILRSLRTQTLVYFLAPLGLAACHSACAIYVVTDGMFSALGVSMTESIAAAALLVGLVYGCYLLLTYFGARSMVRKVCRI